MSQDHNGSNRARRVALAGAQYRMRYRDDALLTRAAHAARRFQFMANCYRARAASPASLRHEAQQIINLLWELGLRPDMAEPPRQPTRAPQHDLQ